MAHYERYYHTTYYVYIAADSLRKALEVGITIDLSDSLRELANHSVPEERRYLLYYESYLEALDGVKREMKLAAFSQWRLRQLVLKQNPQLKFLNEMIVSRTDRFRWQDT